MLLLSVFCVVLSIELGVATPPGNRFKDNRLKKIGNNEFNVERNTGEPMNPYNIVNKHRYERISQENHNHLLKHNKKYENIHSNNNPAAFRNVNEQPDVTSESKELNQNTEERNFDTLNDEPSRTSYIASLPQVNRIQKFRPKDGENNEAHMQRRVDILSEVNDPKNDIAPSQLNPPIIQEKKPANQEIFNDMKEEDTTQFDVPEATPEYTKSLFNEYKHTKENNVKPIITNLPRNDFSNKKYQPNSQNANEATFQNPSAETLYETGQAKPYEISNEPLVNSRQGHTNTHNMLSDKQRLKNLYLSSKPTKHYMIVYPDGRVEQVDQLDKIQKVHPNYVMLNAKELLQHSKSNEQILTGSQGSVVKQNLPATTTTTLKPQLNSIKDNKDNQIDNVFQTVNNPPIPTISKTEVTKANDVAKSSKDEAVTKIIPEKNIQNKLQESGTNESEEKTAESKDIEDIVTTARSTMAPPTANTEILNQTISNSLPTSNNTDNPNLLKEPANNNSTSDGTLIITKDDSVVTDENTTSSPKQESNEEIAKNTTISSDLKAIKENSNSPDDIESNVVNDTNASNSTVVSNKEERNSTINLNNGTVITSEDGTDSDGNKFHTETIITNYVNESKNNVSSSDDSTLVTNTNQTDTSSTVNSENNINTLNATSSDSLTNSTLDQPEKVEYNSDPIKIQNVSNATKSEVDETQNSKSTDASSNNSPGKAYDVSSTQEESNSNKTLSPKIVKDGSKDTDDGPDDSDDLPAGNPDALNEKDGNKATGSSNDGANEDDEDDDTDNNTKNRNDNLDTESPSSDGSSASESLFWFNATESFWKKLMNTSEHNSFYFLFPRPQNTKETKRITYPNGTVVIISTETVDNGDGEATSSKTVLTCGNCTTCEKSS